MLITYLQLSRRLNTVNPNDTLAKRVIDIARHNRSGDAFVKAASSFGKFDNEFLLGIHSQILAFLSANSVEGFAATGRRTSHGASDTAAIENRANLHVGQDEKEIDDGMVHSKSDVQPASEARKGGLFRTGEVSRMM
jgi:pre-mRNA-splicing factor ATP-dependent RNA helicase DHX38/PRP16